MSAYVHPGESVRLEARPHAAALVRPLARATLAGVVGGVLVAAGLPVAWPLGVAGAAVLALAAATAVQAVVAWDRTTLVLTTDKLLVAYGVFRRRTASAWLAHAGGLELEQSPFGRVLGYGTLVAGDLEVPYVPDARRLARSL